MNFTENLDMDVIGCKRNVKLEKSFQLERLLDFDAIE